MSSSWLRRCLVTAGALVAWPVDARDADAGWATMTTRDVTFVRDTIARADIHAIIADASFKRRYAIGTAQALAAAPTARSLIDYQAILKRYFGALQDPHARVAFTTGPTAISWTGFLVRMRGSRYFVVGSRDPRVIDGAEIDGCDGRPLDAILDGMAPLEQAIPGLQSVRAQMVLICTES